MNARQPLRAIMAVALTTALSAGFSGAASADTPTAPRATIARSGGAGRAGSAGRAGASSNGAKNVYGDHGGPVGWCADELETLPNGLCYVKATEAERRTLVIFLHGMIANNVDWQWLQERALTRQARASHFDAVFAKAPLTPSGYIWPGTREAQEANEQALIDGWNEARRVLETRSGKPYDEVFVMGFSSGAYFTSSLALRGRVKADGFAVFAGGAGGPSSPDAAQHPPVFVGVCMDDNQTASHSRGFAGALAARGWPHKVDEQHVGHMFGDVHVAHAVAYLRSQQPKPSR